MKFLIISDIHGSETALQKVLNIYKECDFNKIIICGDLLYHGARNPLPEGYNPKGVYELLNKNKLNIISVRGNCESEVDQMVMEFPVLGDYSYYTIGDRTIFITHGHTYSPDNMPPLNSGDIFVSGHTHIPVNENVKGINIINPGSISLPKGGWEATYGVLTKDKYELKSLNNNATIATLHM